MLGDLNDAFAKEDIRAIMNLTVVPFGNAKLGRFGKLTCQHGEEECEGNSWEQCGIEHNPDVSKHFPYYVCLEQSKGKPTFEKAAMKCASESGLDFSAISTCFNGPEGKQLQRKFSDLTPKHQYTPWVTLNTAVMSQRGTFISNLCKAYKEGGGTPPASCKKFEQKAEPCPAEW